MKALRTNAGPAAHHHSHQGRSTTSGHNLRGPRHVSGVRRSTSSFPACSAFICRLAEKELLQGRDRLGRNLAKSVVVVNAANVSTTNTDTTASGASKASAVEKVEFPREVAGFLIGKKGASVRAVSKKVGRKTQGRRSAFFLSFISLSLSFFRFHFGRNRAVAYDTFFPFGGFSFFILRVC